MPARTDADGSQAKTCAHHRQLRITLECDWVSLGREPGGFGFLRRVALRRVPHLGCPANAIEFISAKTKDTQSSRK